MSNNKSELQSSADSTANSTGESVVTSQGVVITDSGRTASDVASAAARESAAAFPAGSNPISTVGPATTGAGLAPSGAASVIDSSAQSLADSRLEVDPFPVTTGYEQHSQSVLVSQVTAAGWIPGNPIKPFLVVGNSAASSSVQSVSDSKAGSKAASEGKVP